MFDFLSLIGKEKKEAMEILKNAGFEHIITIKNSKHDDLCDSEIVCNAKQCGEQIKLYVGEFCLNIKEK